MHKYTPRYPWVSRVGWGKSLVSEGSVHLSCYSISSIKYWITIIFSFDCYDYDFKVCKDSALPKLTPEKSCNDRICNAGIKFGWPQRQISINREDLLPLWPVESNIWRASRALMHFFGLYCTLLNCGPLHSFVRWNKALNSLRDMMALSLPLNLTRPLEHF